MHYKSKKRWYNHEATIGGTEGSEWLYQRFYLYKHDKEWQELTILKYLATSSR